MGWSGLENLRVMIPDLEFEKELNEADSALDQPPGDQAAFSVGVGGSLADPVHLPGLFVLAVDIERVGCLQLHPGCEFIARDPGSQLWLCRPAPLVNLVEPGDQVALLEGDARRLLELGFQVEDRRAG